MIILMDLEWIGKQDKRLTQLSALRVDEAWNTLAEFHALLDPGETYLRNAEHMALGGYPPESFAGGETAQSCIRRLESWLAPDDELWVWARSNLTLLSALWKRYAARLCPRVLSLARLIRDDVMRTCPQGSPYGLLSSLGETVPSPEHRSANDVDVFRRLLKALALPKERLSAVEPVLLSVPLPQREINRKRVADSQYNYIYLKGSVVFHRPSCPLWLNAANEKDICGSVYYKTAAKKRRPCQRCRPEPLPQELRQPPPAPSKPAAVPPERPSADEVVSVRLLTGQTVTTERGMIVGMCHFPLHPGAVDKQLCKKHDCLGKQCAFFTPNADSFYLASLKQIEQEKQRRKEQARREKTQQAEQENDLRRLKEEWQALLDEQGADMQIVRIERTPDRAYLIFYVSDNRFADANRFPAFIQAVREGPPRRRIILRHIRDLDGHFVTRNEFAVRRLK